MRPAQVLDEQHALHDYLRTRDYQSYSRQFFRSYTGRSVPLDAAHAVADAWREDEIRLMTRAYAFHVSADMTPLIRHAATGLTESMVWDKSVFPTDAGFLVYDDPVPAVDMRGMVNRTAAVSWRWAAHPVSKRGGVYVTFYSDVNDPIDEVSAKTRKMVADNPGRFLNIGHLHIDHSVFMEWGRSVGPTTRTMTPEEVAAYTSQRQMWDCAETPPVTVDVPATNVWRDLYATLALMGQTVTDVTDGDVPRAQAKRLTRKGMPARVTVIRLRRSEGNRAPGESTVEWAHRWVVRGHWRRQRCGEGNREVRTVWIAPFVKGPDGKPFVVSEKVYTLDR